jgi:hypothetical protein
MSKKGSKKNNSYRRQYKSKSKSLLKTLLGGDDGDNVVDSNIKSVGETEKPVEKKSAFDFFDKFSPPKDYKSENGSDEDTSKVSTAKGIFSSSAAVAATATSATVDTESESSTGWFIFRVIIVGIIAIIFILNVSGYLDDLIAWFTNTFGPYINPILVKIGVMDSEPQTKVDNGTVNKTDNVPQLEQNIGAPPPPPPPSPEEQRQQEKINELKPIPIQPDERQTPLRNKHESARPPGTQPAPYQEQKSREQEKKESIQKALEYAEKNPKYPVPDSSSSKTQLPRSNKAYCYIGDDRGHRSCAEVSPSQQCMSGDIFPSMDICVNPRLRV